MMYFINYSIMIDIKKKLLEGCALLDHIMLQKECYNEYISNLLLLLYEYNHEFSIMELAKILTASMVRNDKDLSMFLLKDHRYELPVILKCCDILDSRRLCAQLETKTDKIKDKTKLTKHTGLIANLKVLNEGIDMGLTSSKIKFLKEHWIKNIPKDNLEYMALLYPTKHWKWVIDMMHLKPSDFQLEWFTSYVFTKKYPNDSIIDICNSINSETIKDIIMKYKLPYEFLKLKYKNLLNDDIKKCIFSYTSLADLIRHWDDFNSSEIIELTYGRLINNEEIKMPYGELIKRIQLMKESYGINKVVSKLIDLAETKLCSYKVSIEQPIVVLGDASGSMQVAVKTSSIITSILVKICNAKMHLFREKDELIKESPKNVSDVLNMMAKFQANGGTNPAASLNPYLQRKEIVKTFILVTDEEENGKINNQTFTDLFKQYRETVYPANLVFVSFLKTNQDGQMVRELKNKIPGIEKDIIQFILSNKNPDLRKLDELLNTLSIESEYYNMKYNQLYTFLQKHNIDFQTLDKQNIANMAYSKELNDTDNLSISITI